VEVALIAQAGECPEPLWVWLVGLEHPSAATVAGGIVVIGGVALRVIQGSGSPGGPERPPGDLVGDLADLDASAESAKPG
jgi:hypothetical protein